MIRLENDLSPVLRRLFRLFYQNESRVVRYSEIDRVYSLRGRGRGAFLSNVKLLRRRLKGTGFTLENVNRVGYRMRRRRRMPMHFVEVDEYSSAYAAEFAEVLRELAHKHENVTFSQQISMIGVTLGMIFEEIPAEHQAYYRKLLMANVKDAKNCADMVVMH